MVVTKRYYEKLGGFSYLLSELRKRIGREQTDALVNDAVSLCNELCDKYKGLSKKEKVHTEGMIFPRAAIYLQMIRYISREEALGLIEESVRIGVEARSETSACRDEAPFYPVAFL